MLHPTVDLRRVPVKDERDGPRAIEAVLAAMDRLHSPLVAWEQRVGDNPWKLPPAPVVYKGATSLKRFYASWRKQGKLDEVKSIKVVIIGAAGAGKTRWVSTSGFVLSRKEAGHIEWLVEFEDICCFLVCGGMRDR